MAGKKKKLSEECVLKILSDYSRGLTLISIANTSGVGVRKIKDILVENSIEVSNDRKRIFNEYEIKEIKEKYLKGVALVTLGKEHKIRTSTLRDILIENGVKIRARGEQVGSVSYCTNRKHFFNENYFSEIDDANKAYWLGFLYADGNVYVNKGKNGGSKGATVELTLKRDDEYHLYNFARDIKGLNIPIEQRVIKLNGNEYLASRIALNSITMANNLIQLGCIPNKSLKLEFPQNIKKEYLNHFIRGYIDGDGCIAFYVYKDNSYFNVTLLGTVEFLDGVKNILNEFDIKTSNICAEKSNAFRLGIYGQDNLGKLFNFLYKDANIFLERKREKFTKALLYYDIDFNLSKTYKLFMSTFDDNLIELKARRNMRDEKMDLRAKIYT